MFAITWWTGFMAAVGLPAARLNGQDETAPIDFRQSIKPLLSDRCFVCHGPDEAVREADLRLDTRDGLFAEIDDTLAIVKPGDADNSELFYRIVSDDPDEIMPPPDSNLRLSESEIELIRAWIEQGATWEQHWSFAPLNKVDPPRIRHEAWASNDIDRFIGRKLDQLGWSPAERAGKERLLRRVTFDLTGLPPTLAEIDAFLGDDSAEAYERVVDNLLARESYGERMTADWLDLARYSDSYGYQVDRDRFVWPWRDWVIGAFNDNMPYDQFMIWQLAGDLFPEPSEAQRLATTFNRLHSQKVEGGSVPEEFRVEYVADRTQTFATAFLGLTMECARCHDHKYDPITQRDYFQLFAFFNNIDEAGLYSYFTPSVPTPTMLMLDDAKSTEIEALRAAMEQAEQHARELQSRLKSEYEEWRDGQQGAELVIAGQVAHLDFEEEKKGPNHSVDGVVGRGLKLSGDDGVGVGVGNFGRHQPFSVALWMNTPDVKERAVVFHRSRAWTDAASRGYQLLIEDGKLSWSLIHFWPGNAIRVITEDPLATNAWHHVTVTYDGSSRADGLSIFVDGRRQATKVVRDNLYKQITGGGGDNITIGERFRDRGFSHGSVDDFRVFDRQLSALEIAALSDPSQAELKFTLPQEDSDQSFEHYLLAVDETYAAELAKLQQARKSYNQAVDGVKEIMVMAEMGERRPTYVLRRGAYDAPTDEVAPATPAALPAMSDDLSRDRMGLAQWATGAASPLTARVAVNHYWQLVFGEGLVRTPEDFGSQGEMPTHPELLDWLAADFIEHGWDVKRLLKMMVMSSTYCQDSTATPEARSRDPQNRWLARSPSYRRSAEMLRDNALAVSGLLVDRIGGPPAKPYEVAESFKPVGRDKGDGLYRRSVYTFWKRTGPAPVMMALDAARRDVCVVKRERTATPLQILVLMNDPQLTEAARSMAQTAMVTHGDDDAAIFVDLFRLTTSRLPDDRERSILMDLYADQLEHFTNRSDAVEALLATGELAKVDSLSGPRVAAWTVVTSALLNLDECVTKR